MKHEHCAAALVRRSPGAYVSIMSKEISTETGADAAQPEKIRRRRGLAARLRRLVRPPKSVSVLRLYGPIGTGGRFSRSLTHAALEQDIERAFAASRLAAVALAINSPGGAPAQSALIARHIRRLAKEKSVPVIAFCEGVAASGGYMLACAADEIYADEHSIVGSIGVVSASFGFEDAIGRIGVRRRLHTAGENKSLLDPFSPEKPEQVERLKGFQREIHARFIDLVRESRGDRLSDGEPLFEGDVWVGAQAQALGLIDGVGHLRPIMQARFGKEVRFREIAPKKGLLGPFGGASAVDQVPGALETRAAFGRFGL